MGSNSATANPFVVIEIATGPAVPPFTPAPPLVLIVAPHRRPPTTGLVFGVMPKVGSVRMSTDPPPPPVPPVVPPAPPGAVKFPLTRIWPPPAPPLNEPIWIRPPRPPFPAVPVQAPPVASMLPELTQGPWPRKLTTPLLVPPAPPPVSPAPPRAVRLPLL